MQDKIKWASISTAAVYVVAGIALLLYPGQIRQMFCDLFGIAMIVYGIINIVVYFMIDIRESLYRNDFSSGIIKILLGVMVIYHKEMFAQIIPFLLAIAIIASGFSKLQDGVDAARIGYPRSWMYVILAIISVGCGVVVLFDFIRDPDKLLQFSGAALLYSGLTDLFSTLSLSGKIRRFLQNGGIIKPKPEEKKGETEEPSSTAQYVNWNTSAEGMEAIREDRYPVHPIPALAEPKPVIPEVVNPEEETVNAVPAEPLEEKPEEKTEDKPEETAE
ncbi:MAG: DUF308 domain-containing protein [Solobacterium sp.]|nr:DUF308 domain-containing protein [Solobacterium sp.]